MADASAGVLDEDGCWTFLETEELGRLAFRMTDELHIVPINYAVDGRTLLFRTAPGDKLLAIAMGGEVAFEADRIDGEHATSVVVRGRARILEEDEAHRAELVPLRTWVDKHKYEVVEIKPEHISGRSYDLDRPWLHMLHDPAETS